MLYNLKRFDLGWQWRTSKRAHLKVYSFAVCFRRTNPSGSENACVFFERSESPRTGHRSLCYDFRAISFGLNEGLSDSRGTVADPTSIIRSQAVALFRFIAKKYRDDRADTKFAFNRKFGTVKRADVLYDGKT